MAVFKCKMCGGSLEVSTGETIIECEYCGTQQTLPKTTDENIQALFNRANLLRQKNEFDKAETLYEKILETDDTEAEAYWGVILCKFGIEYVEDPKTYKRMPTCHRTSYDSIVADEYYKKALEYADIAQRSIYESEAKKIDSIQKGILAIATQEEPYDVFICYKETDENGKRTQDSVIANDIYHQLTQEGFKVFYAAITLEDKLGSAYEPIIFAALNSSKVMLAIGTKPEYFNAVWVKNEWSRFLKMMKNNRTKLLIPCYRGMDAYELPEEFAHLQAQDMGKIGFINDVVRGVKKVIIKDEPKAVATVVKETVINSSTPSVAPLLKRAFMFLEDGDWKCADEYCERVLDIDPENAEAYLGKLMVDLKVKTKDSICNFNRDFSDYKNYKKIMSFGSEELKQFVNKQLEKIELRKQRELEEIELREQREKSKNEELNRLADELERLIRNNEHNDKNKEELQKLLNDRQKLENLQLRFPSIYEKTKKLCDEKLQKQNELKNFNDEKKSLGIFAFGRKKELQELCSACECEIRKLDSLIATHKKEMCGYKEQNQIDSMLELINKQLDNINKAIEKEKESRRRENEIRSLLGKEYNGRYILREIECKIKHEKYAPGNIITFGKYKGKDIKWIVLDLDKNDDAILLISADIVDSGRFCQSAHYCGWHQSELKTWLNETFIQQAFTKDQLEKIYENDIDDNVAERKPLNSREREKEKAYVLSIDEAKKYSTYVLKYGDSWWLRSKGAPLFNGCAASYVTKGDISLTMSANLDCIGIRPVIWLNI